MLSIQHNEFADKSALALMHILLLNQFSDLVSRSRSRKQRRNQHTRFFGIVTVNGDWQQRKKWKIGYKERYLQSVMYNLKRIQCCCTLLCTSGESK